MFAVLTNSFRSQFVSNKGKDKRGSLVLRNSKIAILASSCMLMEAFAPIRHLTVSVCPLVAANIKALLPFCNKLKKNTFNKGKNTMYTSSAVAFVEAAKSI